MADRAPSFTTDSEGRLDAKVRLYRDTTYEAIPKTKPAAPKSLDANWLASSLDAALLGDIRTLRAGVDLYLADKSRRAADRLGGANFLLAAASFMLLEYVARIFNGDDNAVENFKAYAARFLDFEPRYKQLADVLWRVFRNGIVHGAWPQALSQDGSAELIRVGVGVEPDDPHLAPDPRLQGPTFVLNAVQLAADVERSMTAGFLEWLRAASPDVVRRGSPRLLMLREHDAAWTQLEQIKTWNGERTPG